MSDGVRSRAECSACGGALAPSHSGPCPHCGKAAGKAIQVRIADRIAVRDGAEVRGIPAGRGRSRFFVMSWQGAEFFRKTQRWHRVERVVDRRDNRYYEHIEDEETGEVIRHKDEPLSDHVAERDQRRRKEG